MAFFRVLTDKSKAEFRVVAEGIENISEDLLDSDDGLLFSFKLIKAVVYLFVYLYLFIFIYLFISDIYAGWPSSASSWFEWGPA